MLPQEVPSGPQLLTTAGSFLPTVLYDPKAFFTHAALLRQGFPHCAIFLTAASRRSLARVSVPVWLIILSDQLWIGGLVSRYLTNYLIQRRPILEHPKTFIQRSCDQRTICGISYRFR